MLLYALILALAGSATGLRCGMPAVVSTVRAPAASMALYDWKTRGDPPPALEELSLGNMKVAPGSHKSATRKGRGISAGQGATCGFGTRGQKSRSGRSVRPGFEGGQIPLYRRLQICRPPMGMAHSYTKYGIIKTSALNGVEEGATVDYEALQEKRFVSKSK